MNNQQMLGLGSLLLGLLFLIIGLTVNKAFLFVLAPIFLFTAIISYAMAVKSGGKSKAE